MLRRIEEAGPQHIATDCPLSALRIEEGLQRKAVHPVVLLRHAYGSSPPNEAAGPSAERHPRARLIYRGLRPEYRAREVIAHKDRTAACHRRDRVTLLFEDRETLRYQILEMCRVEGARDAESASRTELDVYNELMPWRLANSRRRSSSRSPTSRRSGRSSSA